MGGEGGRWDTRGSVRRVLLVVHNVTSATRLLDVLPLLRDWRIQLLATCTGSSPFQAGVPELLAEVGVPVLPWAQALRTPVDLAVSASFGGQLHELCGKLTVLSHGVGYNKTLATPDAGRRTPDAGRRTPDAGRRTPDAGRPPTPSSSRGCGRRARPPRTPRCSPGTPASTGCWPPAPTASVSAGPSGCGPGSG
ncbi:hypothetical protein [Streptomyces catenulae]|uniref:hypothetical protein n=1 Tax=Streptomyces catenulae TaxID=66875 RepID=UPI001FDEB319|nr:hypothetical protein [Streptomyces catenulae]